ncbi:MAG: PQQ-like beta-propeller repeat protein [Pirellulaceae bacterium]|nr:PQQ-like beta-propeller repeat protein [Pirellulaceae bacterium]
MKIFLLSIGMGLLLTSLGYAQIAAEAESWAAWRGPLGTGEAPAARPPLVWSETENIKWKTKIPGRGHSTPIVWNDLVFLTAAEPFGEKQEPKYSERPGAHDNLAVAQKHRFLVMAINRKDGSILWKKQVHEELPREGAHYTASLTSASPVTDGQYLYVHLGSYGLYCLDFEGRVIWQKMLGKMHTKHGHGEGASPVLHRGVLVVNWDHEEASFIAAIDAKSGKEIWRQPRSEVTSWSSPIVVEHAGQTQIIVAGTHRVRAYDIRNGKTLWECGGLSNNVVATPVAADGIVIVGSSYEKRAMFAIQLEGAEGDITDSDNILWFTRERTPYVPSPLLYQGSVYYLRHYQNILSRRDVITGQERSGPFRLQGLRDIYASPVAAANRIYITDREGVTIVFQHVADEATTAPRLLAANRIDDNVNASLALVGNQILIRGETFLYCIEEKTRPKD